MISFAAFPGWSGSCSSDTGCQTTMNVNGRNAAVVFRTDPQNAQTSSDIGLSLQSVQEVNFFIADGNTIVGK
jgi:hypothetical protein